MAVMSPKPIARKDAGFPEPPAGNASADAIRAGETKFVEQCSRCHTLGPNITPALRKMSPEVHRAFEDILLGGALATRGMEGFDDILSEEEVEDIHAYLIDEARRAYRLQQASQGLTFSPTNAGGDHADRR